MTIARTSPEHRTSAAGHPDLANRHQHRASKLFEKSTHTRLAWFKSRQPSATWSGPPRRRSCRMKFRRNLKGNIGSRQASSGDRGRTEAAHRRSVRSRRGCSPGFGLTRGATGAGNVA